MPSSGAVRLPADADGAVSLVRNSLNPSRRGGAQRKHCRRRIGVRHFGFDYGRKSLSHVSNAPQRLVNCSTKRDCRMLVERIQLAICRGGDAFHVHQSGDVCAGHAVGDRSVLGNQLSAQSGDVDASKGNAGDRHLSKRTEKSPKRPPTSGPGWPPSWICPRPPNRPADRVRPGPSGSGPCRLLCRACRAVREYLDRLSRARRG